MRFPSSTLACLLVLYLFRSLVCMCLCVYLLDVHEYFAHMYVRTMCILAPGAQEGQNRVSDTLDLEL